MLAPGSSVRARYEAKLAYRLLCMAAKARGNLISAGRAASLIIGSVCGLLLGEILARVCNIPALVIVGRDMAAYNGAK